MDRHRSPLPTFPLHGAAINAEILIAPLVYGEELCGWTGSVH
jgi:hypothetical protein